MANIPPSDKIQCKALPGQGPTAEFVCVHRTDLEPAMAFY